MILSLVSGVLPRRRSMASSSAVLGAAGLPSVSLFESFEVLAFAFVGDGGVRVAGGVSAGLRMRLRPHFISCGGSAGSEAFFARLPSPPLLLLLVVGFRM